MVTPPLRTLISGTPTNAQANAGLGQLYDYTINLLGTAGTAADARTRLGVHGATESDARSYRTLNGRAILLAVDTDIQVWADTLPPSGLYNVELTAPQGNLPPGWWYLELLVHSNSSVPTQLHSTITATWLNGASGIKFTNTRIFASWGGWVQMVPIAATDAVSGIVELATGAEAAAGTDAERIVTPAALRAGLNATGSAPVFACRAWVSFDAAGAITGSGNVSSVTKLGAGHFRINFVTAMPDGNYVVNGMATTITNHLSVVAFGTALIRTTTHFEILTGNTGGAGSVAQAYDTPLTTIAVFR